MSDFSDGVKRIRQLYGALCGFNTKAKALEHRRELLDVEGWSLDELELAQAWRDSVEQLVAAALEELADLENVFEEFGEDIHYRLDADEDGNLVDEYHERLDELRAELGLDEAEEEDDDDEGDEEEEEDEDEEADEDEDGDGDQDDE